MSDKSKISWCDATWQVIAGCSPASPGCAHCFSARLLATRHRHLPWAKGLAEMTPTGPRWTGRVVCRHDQLDWPMRKRKPLRIFVGDRGDLFHEQVPDSYVLEVLRRAAICPQHTFLVLTKRPERMRAWFAKWGDAREDSEPVMARGPKAIRAAHKTGRAHLFADMIEAWGDPPNGYAHPLYDWADGMRWWPSIFENLWLGVSIEDQQRADERVPELLATPAAHRFLSIEPMLGPIDLPRVQWPGKHKVDVLRGGTWTEKYGFVNHHDLARIDQVIVGCESGPGARPCPPEWIANVVAQCKLAETPCFVKQIQLDGSVLRDPSEWPASLRVRELAWRAAR